MNIKLAKILASFTLAISLISFAHANEDGLSLPQNGSEPVAVRISEGAVDWEHAKAVDLLQVFVGGTDLCCEGRTPIAGRYALEDNAVTFTPAFGFALDQDYVVRAQLPGQGEKLIEFTIPSKTPVIEAAVTEIYPSGNTLPENVLRFYVHFSVPMAPRVAFNHIKLRDSSGNADEAAFMRFKQELWNEDRTRLTVLIDPGRIKREVATNLELGPALLAGKHYTFSVDGGWPSADGTSVLPPFSRTFIVSHALRERPDARLWHAISPCLGTREPLAISLDRPFDRHLLSKGIRIVAGDGQIIDGAIHVSDGERLWNFTPNTPWTHEDLNVVAKVKLEDVAGNNFRDLLDQAVTEQESNASVTTMTVHLERCSG